MTTANSNSENILTPDQVVERGQKIYIDKLKSQLEPKERGKFVVIDVQTEDYFVADTLIDALQKAKEKYPQKLFHTIKIGFEGIFKMGTYTRRGFSYGWNPSK